MIYFPTTVVLIDDDTTFLEEVGHKLSPLNITLKSFNTCDAALDFLNLYLAHLPANEIYPPLNEDAFQEWLTNFLKKNPEVISCVIADEQIHNQSGSALLNNIPADISKVLLTGTVESSAGINALNQKEIGKFIEKDNTHHMLNLENLVQDEVDRFFLSHFRLGSTLKEAQDLLKLCNQHAITQLIPLDFTGAYKATTKEGATKRLFAPAPKHLQLQHNFLKSRKYPLELCQRILVGDSFVCMPADDLIDLKTHDPAALPLKSLHKGNAFTTLTGYVFGA